VSLPITAEIDARLVPHRQHRNAVGLKAVRVFPAILAPRHLLREPDQVWADDVVVVPDLRSAHPGEE
jgi:hypothetical protein